MPILQPDFMKVRTPTPAEQADAAGVYLFIITPSHGYLRVPLAECEGLDISHYSYKDQRFAYLEEDSDMSKFILARCDGYIGSNIHECHDESFDRRRHSFEGLRRFK